MRAEVANVKPWKRYGERAWAAWQSLDERGKHGSAPSIRSLQRRSDLLNQGELDRFIHGEYAEPSWRVARGVAEVLKVDLDWLMLGKGEAPKRSVDLGGLPPWPGPRASAPKPKGRAKVSREDEDVIEAEQGALANKQTRKPAKPAETKPKPKKSD